MVNIHSVCVQYGTQPDGYINYVVGANIGGFMKVANAMLAQGLRITGSQVSSIGKSGLPCQKPGIFIVRARRVSCRGGIRAETRTGSISGPKTDYRNSTASVATAKPPQKPASTCCPLWQPR